MNNEEMLNKIRKELEGYEDKKLRIGQRMGYNDTYKDFLHEGPITNVKDLNNEIEVTFRDVFNPFYDPNSKEITFKILGYNKPVYDSLFEFQLQDIIEHPKKGVILEIIVGQNKEESGRLVIRQ